MWGVGDNVATALHTGDLASGVQTGTSFAAALVAGVAARLLQELPSESPATILETLKCLATNNSIASVPSNTVNRMLHGVCV